MAQETPAPCFLHSCHVRFLRAVSDSLYKTVLYSATPVLFVYFTEGNGATQCPEMESRPRCSEHRVQSPALSSRTPTCGAMPSTRCDRRRRGQSSRSCGPATSPTARVEHRRGPSAARRMKEFWKTMRLTFVEDGPSPSNLGSHQLAGRPRLRLSG